MRPRLTVVCVHGNPTWSYLWRSLLASAPEDVRVIAVDQLDMGYSERTGTTRGMQQRADDLGRVLDVLVPSGPIVVVAHDWGGPISIAWAAAHRARVAALVLLNTAVHQPSDSMPPAVIRLARMRGILRACTATTPAFVHATTALSRVGMGRSSSGRPGSGRPGMSRKVASAYAAPYRSADRRMAIEGFVLDIPLEANHPSRDFLDQTAQAATTFTDVPVLLLWGPGDPVFADRYLDDLVERMPHAHVHRYEGARHLVIEDAPRLTNDLWRWLASLDTAAVSPAVAGADATAISGAGALWSELQRRAGSTPHACALAEPNGSGGFRKVTWQRLADTVDQLARGLIVEGIRPGDRVAVLITPGADLLAVIYACWRIGASVVVTDAGLGARGIHRALRGARPDVVIAIPRGMALVRASALPGRRIPVSQLPRLARQGVGGTLPAPPDPEAEAVVVFTSGSTGPAKGVVYRHRQVAATRDLLRRHYRITDDDALVAAFAPWAVLGPALGIASVIPDMDVTSPRTLQARAFADATAEVDGTLAWASPAAFSSILRSAGTLTPSQRAALQSLRLVLGAGAPVSKSILEGMAALCPQAEVRTPYGMTEVLPVSDVTLQEIRDSGEGPGVLVGRPLPGVRVCISPVDESGIATGALTDEPGVLGEVLVQATHRKDRYDRLHFTEAASADHVGWHRTGDVGSLDGDGRLWIGGRLAHVVTTADGPVAPVEVEQRVQGLSGVAQAACVGVGPVGCQVVVVVVVLDDSPRGDGCESDLTLLDRVRKVAGLPVAAVLTRTRLPVDIRHNSKIDRASLAEWASSVLAGSS